jgi:hypothetical protein
MLHLTNWELKMRGQFGLESRGLFGRKIHSSKKSEFSTFVTGERIHSPQDIVSCASNASTIFLKSSAK